VITCRAMNIHCCTLGHPGRADLRPPGGRDLVQVRLHHIDIAVDGLQRHYRGCG